MALGFSITAAALLGAGCGSSDSGGGGGSAGGKGGAGGGSGGGENPPSCKSLCDHITSICGMALPNCDQVCAAATKAEQTCIAKASSCDEANGCDTSSGSSGGSTSAGGGGSGGSSGGVACDPYEQFTDTDMHCAQGCATADAEDQMSLWCLKHCDNDDDCSCSGSSCGAVSKCVEGTELGNPKVCAPGCFNDDDCASHGWGKCQTLTGNYCDGGPHTNTH